MCLLIAESFKDVLIINSPHTNLLELEPSDTTVEINNNNNKNNSSSSNSEKLQQALLDISMFVRHETYNFECTKGQVSQEDENHHRHHHSFIHKILSAGQVLCSRPGDVIDWFDENLAIDPSLFDRLENDDDYEEDTDTGFWRCDRRLLFDCTNEAVSLKLGKPQLSCLLQSPRVTDEKLVEEVYAKILEWQELPSYSISGLIEKDMGSRVGKWSNLSEEIAEVGLEVECLVWKTILEDVVLDLIITASEKEMC